MKLSRKFAAMATSITAMATANQAAAATIEVFKSPYCGCCEEWVRHVREAGFTVKVTNLKDVTPVANRLGVPDSLRSCHTARVGKYVIEGHVPASDIKQLLKRQPTAIGIAVAGMPAGSPGMDQGPSRQAYETILFTAKGSRVFAAH